MGSYGVPLRHIPQTTRSTFAASSTVALSTAYRSPWRLAIRALQRGSRVAPVARARERVAYLAIEVEGYAGRAVADVLGVGTPSVYKAVHRGRVTSRQWDRPVLQESE